MMLYDLFFNFIHENLFSISDFTGLPANFDYWLSHVFTILSMSLIFFVLVKFVICMFKFGAGLFFWK